MLVRGQVERKEGGSSCWPGAKLSLQRRATNYGLKQPQRTSKVSWERGIIILGVECGMSLWGNITRTAQWKATLECLAIEDNVGCSLFRGEKRERIFHTHITQRGK